MARKLPPKVHKLTIRNRNANEVSKGATTEVLLDGKPLRLVTSLRYEVKGGGLARVTIEMLASVKVDTIVQKNQITKIKKTAAEIVAQRRK